MVMNNLEIKGFNKGVVSTSKVGIGRESDGIARYGANVRFINGNVVSRLGYIRYCNFHLVGALDNGYIRSLGEYKRESYSGGVVSYWRCVVFTANGKFWYIQPEVSTTMAIQIDGHPQSNSEFRYVNVYDHLWIFNGQDPVYTWDGIEVVKAGIAAPTGSLSAHINTGAAGTLSVKYKLTYYKDSAPYNKESNPTNEVTLAGLDSTDLNNHVVYTPGGGGTEVIDAQVTHVHIYRTDYWDPTTDEEPVDFYLLPDITLPAFALAGYQYTDDEETVTGSTLYIDDDRGVPPVSKYGLWHDSRLFLAGDPDNPSVICYSEPGKPWYFPTLNYDEVNRDDGSIITGLGAIGPTRYIFKDRVIYEWTGNPETATPIRQVERPDATQNMARVAIGCAYPDTLVGWNNSIIFRAYDGDVYMITQDELTNLSRYYESVKNLDDSCAAYVKDNYYVIGGSTGSYTCYLPDQSWQSVDDIKFNYALVRYTGDVLVPDRYDTGVDNGQGATIWAPVLNRLHSSYQDNGVDFIKSFQSKYLKMADNNEIAIIKNISVFSSANVAYYVTVYNESGENIVGLYNPTTKMFVLPTPLYAKWVSVRISWTLHSNEVYGFNVGYIRRGRR